MATAAALARSAMQQVRENPEGRLRLLRSLYESDLRGDARLPYRRAATAFMGWQLHRGVLEPEVASRPGSPWWRAVNEALITVTAEARCLHAGHSGTPSSPAVAAALQFIRRPSASRWYRTHNMALAEAYLAHRALAEQENRIERFFINLVLVRVLYAHALVAEPRLALGWCAPLGPVLGDPRLGMTGIFLSLARVLPMAYPLRGTLERYVEDEHGLGHLLDVGVIRPRMDALYEWSAEQLAMPELTTLCTHSVPTYAWEPVDDRPWNPPPAALARTARRLLPGR